jgi:hypothetical protein
MALRAVIDGEPADFLRFLWLAVTGVAASDAGEVSGRSPVEGFEKIEFAADDAPASGLGRTAAKGEKQAAGFVDQKDSHANPGVIRAEQGDAPFALN